MCGIAGIFQLHQKYSSTELLKLSDILKHRGPDDEGFCLFNEQYQPRYFKGNDSPGDVALPLLPPGQTFRAALLHRRLSIVDLSAAGHQPMVKQGCVLVFNGEIYNYKAIRQKLEQKGYTFDTQTDTEVILTAYLDKGADCVHEFKGMWSFAIYDTVRKSVFFSRDRYGIKPLYIYRKDDVFIFSSEIKGITALPGVDLALDNKNLSSFLAFGTMQQPYGSLYRYIHDFPPAHYAYFHLDSGEMTYFSYYRLPDENAKEQTAFSRLQHFFDTSVQAHLQADVEVGSCLSGGLDSSLLVAKMCEQNPAKNFKTFTAAYHQPEIDESEFAKAVARTYPNITDYYTYPDEEVFFNELDRLLYYQDLPIGSTSIFAQWEVMKSVKNDGKIKVVIDGQGADEIFGGYFHFAGIFLIELLKKGKINRFVKEYQLLKQRFSPAMFGVLSKALYYYMPEWLQKAIRRQQRLSYRFLQKDWQQQIDIPLRGGKTFYEHSVLAVRWSLYDLLRYEDRNSMAFSVESRVPFLDHQVVDAAVNLPFEQKIVNGWTKYPVRQLMQQTRLPENIVWRTGKKGFITPQAEWKNRLAHKMKDELHGLALPEVMDKSYISELINRPITDTWHLSEFWRAYSVIKWYNRNR